MKKRHQQKFLAWAVFGALILNPPIIMALNQKFVLWGIPSFYVFVFIIWTLTIALNYIWIKKYGE